MAVPLTGTSVTCTLGWYCWLPAEAGRELAAEATLPDSCGETWPDLEAGEAEDGRDMAAIMSDIADAAGEAAAELGHDAGALEGELTSLLGCDACDCIGGLAVGDRALCSLAS